MSRLGQSLARLWAPPSTISVSKWADSYRYLSPERAAEAGKWKSFPFQREPMDAAADPSIRRVVLKCATQLLKSSVIENAIGRAIDADPGPILVLVPRKEDALDFSEENLGPMFRDTPRLATNLKLPRSGRAPKRFKGGRLTITFASVASNVAKRAIRYLFCDEVDKFPPSADDEGNPISLARKRMATFRHRAKEVLASSPTVENSEIDRNYQMSDQREYYLPCPHCSHPQSLMKAWHQVRWDETLPSKEEQALSARYYCQNPECGQPWEDAQRWDAVYRADEPEWRARGCGWRARQPFNGIAGYWISELYSLHKRLSEIVLDYLQKKDSADDLKTFVNTSLAENWIAQGEAPEYDRLLAQAEEYTPGIAPEGALVLTAGADVHPDRIEVEIVGWGRGFESWSVDYQILEGDTSELIGRNRTVSGERIQSPWEKLSALMTEVFPHEKGGDCEIALLFIDSGHATQTVYHWVRQQNPARVMAIKGEAKGRLPVSQPTSVDLTAGGRVVKSGLKLRHINTSYFKGELYTLLKKRPPTQEERDRGVPYPIGYCHFPKGAKNYGDEHFKQLCAEQLVTYKDRRNYQRQEWQQLRARNEALDVRVYAYAAAWQLGIGRYREYHWRELEGRFGPHQGGFELQAPPASVPLPPGSASEPLHTSAPPASVPAFLAAAGMRPPVRPLRGRFI